MARGHTSGAKPKEAAAPPTARPETTEERVEVEGRWHLAYRVLTTCQRLSKLGYLPKYLRAAAEWHASTRGDLLADGAGAWAYGVAVQFGCQRLLYDSIGVGAGAAASLRNKKDIRIEGWNAAGAVVNRSHRYEGNRKNEDMFANAKAQSWWGLRDRFLATFRAINAGHVEDPDKIISLSMTLEELRELKSELSQITYEYNSVGKVVIKKAPWKVYA